MTGNALGAGLMVAAMVAFGVEDALYKGVTAVLPAGQALAMFGATGLILFSLLAKSAGDAPFPRLFLSRGLLLRSLFEFTGRFFFALALALTPLSTTTAILQATPLVVTAGAAVFMGERVGARRWIAMAVGFAGVLVILRPTPEAFRADALLAVAATLGFAARDLATRAAPQGVSRWQLGTNGFLSLTLAGLVMMAMGAEAPVVPAPATLLWLGATGVIGVCAYTALTLAMRMGEVSVIAPFRYTRLLVAILFAVVFFGESIDLTTVAGAVLIVGSGLYTLLRSRRAA